MLRSALRNRSCMTTRVSRLVTFPASGPVLTSSSMEGYGARAAASNSRAVTSPSRLAPTAVARVSPHSQRLRHVPWPHSQRHYRLRALMNAGLIDPSKALASLTLQPTDINAAVYADNPVRVPTGESLSTTSTLSRATLLVRASSLQLALSFRS